MSYKISIIEDAKPISSFIEKTLPKALKEIKVSSFWGFNDNLYKKIEYDVKPFDNKLIKDLTSKDIDSGKFSDILIKALVEISPNLLIVDLALTNDEIIIVEEKGGMNVSGKSSGTEVIENVTGIKILKCLNKICNNSELLTQLNGVIPIAIVSTHIKNPRVHTACREYGAYSIIWKPLTDEKMSAYWDVLNNPVLGEIVTMENIKKIKQFKPRIENYISNISNEVVKSIKESALRHSFGYSPGPVPFWAVTNDAHLSGKKISDTCLMLMDIRGFSKLVEFGKKNPTGVFKIMNTIWESVLTILQKYQIEVNNFIGDAALTFRGVYSDHDDPNNIVRSIDCAKELCDIFQKDGKLRILLKDNIEDAFGDILYREDQKKMIKQISNNSFGIRIVITKPDKEEALYGKIGNNNRWQHTILSRFMNALARVESLIGKWEKQDSINGGVPSAHCFLLWDKDKKNPKIDGIIFKKRNEYLTTEHLKKLKENVEMRNQEKRDIPEEMQVLQIGWQ